MTNVAHREAEINILMEDVKAFRFFRIPILKQLAIQDFYEDQEIWQEIMLELRKTNSDFAAQLTLEIIGKIQDYQYSFNLCNEWISDYQETFENIICETVSYYPKSRIRIALELLMPFLDTNREIAIYSLCKDSFARLEPDLVCDFLNAKLQDIKYSKNDDKKTYYKDALCAGMHYGGFSAFDDLLELFKYLKSGQQAGILLNVENSINDRNLTQVCFFLADVFDSVARAGRREVRDAFIMALSKVHKISPPESKKLVKSFSEKLKAKEDLSSVIFQAQIFGKTLADESVFEQAVADIASDDHNIRLMNAELLFQAPSRFSAFIMNRILSIEPSLYKEKEKSRSIFRVVSGLKNIEPDKIFHFLKEWGHPNTVTTEYRGIFKNLAKNNPQETRKYLLENVDAGDSKSRETVIYAFTNLAKENIKDFAEKDIETFYNFAMESPKNIKTEFAKIVGCIALLDENLADRIFREIINREGKFCQLAVIGSLRYCLAPFPEFILHQGKRIVNLALSRGIIGLLHVYLDILKDYQRPRGYELLECLNNWFTDAYFQRIRDEKSLNGILSILKIFAEENPYLALKMSNRFPLLTKGVAGALSALYDNISAHCDDRAILLKLVDQFAEVCKFNQRRISNSLRRALPRLDLKLGDRIVVDMILMTYKQIKEEQALEALIAAAIKVSSWTEQDTITLLEDTDFSGPARGLLLARRKE